MIIHILLFEEISLFIFIVLLHLLTRLPTPFSIGLPFVILLGRTVSFSGQDCVAVYGRGPCLVIELVEGSAAWGRIVVSSDSADQLAAAILAARDKLKDAEHAPTAC